MSTAAKFGHSDIVEYLISVKAPFNKMNKSHMAPIHFAAIRGDGKMVELLASSGAENDNRDLSGSTPIHYLAWLGKESQKR
ncbi:MAG: ankyrin repeat domain-containing protein [Shewanella sp.]|nr:ankyrin repeat domain-containing protein [Shewanella sp.]